MEGQCEGLGRAGGYSQTRRWGTGGGRGEGTMRYFYVVSVDKIAKMHILAIQQYKSDLRQKGN
jgi:hypothetical protein